MRLSRWSCGHDERRNHPRLKCKGVAELRILPAGGKMAAALIDLSIKGCCIEADNPIPAFTDTRVEVHLRMKGFTLRLAGAVRRLQGETQVGIEFIDMSDRKEEQIRELMADLFEMEQDYLVQAQGVGGEMDAQSPSE
ncbi:MAG: PilZ domain-containing protein [Terracidiphilus sp.]